MGHQQESLTVGFGSTLPFSLPSSVTIGSTNRPVGSFLLTIGGQK
jgi:hypothetical protein